MYLALKCARSSIRSAASVKTIREMSSRNKDLSYEQLLSFINKKSSYLVDVREKKELEETGTLPGSLHIPLSEIEKALTLPGHVFEKFYGKRKPTPEDEIIFSCHAGIRSMKAMQKAESLGYENAMNYKGGWSEWAAKTK